MTVFAVMRSPTLAGHRPRQPWRWWGWLLAGVCCGVLVALSVPPFGFWPLAWVGYAGLAWFVPGRRLGARVLLGLGAGLGQYVIGLEWVSEFSIPGCIALMLLGGLFVCATVAVVPSGRVCSVALGLPAAFLASDWLRARFPLGGFPLGGTSLGQAASPLVPSVRLGGGLLLTAETVLAGVVLAQALRLALVWKAARQASGPAPAKFWAAGRAFGGALVVAVAVPLIGWLSPSGAGGHLPALRVALVQGGGARGTRAIHTDPDVVFERHIQAAASIRTPVQLVVLPEGVLQTAGPFQATPGARQLAGLARRLGATVLAGVEQDVPPDRYLVEAAAWSPAGAVVAVYVKNHLVPFGEYVPWRSFISRYFNVSDVPYDAIPGHSPAFMKTPAAPLGVMISYEVFFGERARSGVRAGGQVLVVPTNTASYRSSQVPSQELAAARLRAWETGRWLLQVTPTGYSAVVDPEGRVVERSTLGARQVLEATVHKENGRTWYVDLGDTVVVGAAGAAWVAAVLLGWRRRLPGGELRGDQQGSRGDNGVGPKLPPV